MTKQKRWAAIIDLCQKEEQVPVEELVEKLDASPATIRRDLGEMEDLNMVVRYHGGVRLDSAQQSEPGMALKSQVNRAAKRQIAFAAARKVHDNQMIYIDAGSTTYEMIAYLTARNITVVTPGIPHLRVLGEKRIPTIVLGGRLYWPTQTVSGRQAMQMLSEMYFDAAFIGANGIHEQIGFTTSNDQEADTKSLAITHARHPYILADHSKFNVLGAVPFAKLTDAVIITDSIGDFDPALIRYLQTDGKTNLR